MDRAEDIRERIRKIRQEIDSSTNQLNELLEAQQKAEEAAVRDDFRLSLLSPLVQNIDRIANVLPDKSDSLSALVKMLHFALNTAYTKVSGLEIGDATDWGRIIKTVRKLHIIVIGYEAAARALGNEMCAKICAAIVSGTAISDEDEVRMQRLPDTVSRNDAMILIFRAVGANLDSLRSSNRGFYRSLGQEGKAIMKQIISDLTGTPIQR